MQNSSFVSNVDDLEIEDLVVGTKVEGKYQGEGMSHSLLLLLPSFSLLLTEAPQFTNQLNTHRFGRVVSSQDHESAQVKEGFDFYL